MDSVVSNFTQSQFGRRNVRKNSFRTSTRHRLGGPGRGADLQKAACSFSFPYPFSFLPKAQPASHDSFSYFLDTRSRAQPRIDYPSKKKVDRVKCADKSTSTTDERRPWVPEAHFHDLLIHQREWIDLIKLGRSRSASFVDGYGDIRRKNPGRRTALVDGIFCRSQWARVRVARRHLSDAGAAICGTLAVPRFCILSSN